MKSSIFLAKPAVSGIPNAVVIKKVQSETHSSARARAAAHGSAGNVARNFHLSHALPRVFYLAIVYIRFIRGNYGSSGPRALARAIIYFARRIGIDRPAGRPANSLRLAPAFTLSIHEYNNCARFHLPLRRRILRKNNENDVARFDSGRPAAVMKAVQRRGLIRDSVRLRVSFQQSYYTWDARVVAARKGVPLMS